jgi:hypothetical protein
MGYNIYSDCYAGCFLSIIFLKLEEYSNIAIYLSTKLTIHASFDLGKPKGNMWPFIIFSSFSLSSKYLTAFSNAIRGCIIACFMESVINLKLKHFLNLYRKKSWSKAPLIVDSQSKFLL